MISAIANVARIRAVESAAAIPEAELARMATLLEQSGRYRTLRRLSPRSQYAEPDGTPVKRGIFLDVETTGLDRENDEIIELAMVPFDFSGDGRIFAVHDSFGRYRDPGRPIPPGITALTGITDAMVAGRSIDPGEVEAFLEDVVIVVAHNAAFDRAFSERICAAFARIAWACSWSEINWAGEGFTDGTKLCHLAACRGFFFESHRAEDDCLAGIELLSGDLPRSGRRAMGILLESARTPCWRVWATGAPFEHKNALSQRGYRWNDGVDGRPRAWFLDVAAENLEEERQFLRSKVFRRDRAPVDARRIDAVDRYSRRA